MSFLSAAASSMRAASTSFLVAFRNWYSWVTPSNTWMVATLFPSSTTPSITFQVSSFHFFLRHRMVPLAHTVTPHPSFISKSMGFMRMSHMEASPPVPVPTAHSPRNFLPDSAQSFAASEARVWSVFMRRCFSLLREASAFLMSASSLSASFLYHSVFFSM